MTMGRITTDPTTIEDMAVSTATFTEITMKGITGVGVIMAAKGTMAVAAIVDFLVASF